MSCKPITCLDPLLSLSLPDSTEQDYEDIIGIILTNAFEVVSIQNLLVVRI